MLAGAPVTPYRIFKIAERAHLESPPAEILISEGSATNFISRFQTSSSSLPSLKVTVLDSPGARTIFSKPFSSFTRLLTLDLSAVR